MNRRRKATENRLSEAWDSPACLPQITPKSYDGIDSIRHLTNFGRSVLGCIEAYDSETRRIFQHFSKSTRCAFLCTTRNSIFAKKLTGAPRKRVAPLKHRSGASVIAYVLRRSTEINRSQRRSIQVNRRQQKSTEVNTNQ